MSRLGVLRAAWGTLQLLGPGLIAGWLGDRPLDRRGTKVARLLASRQLLQAVASGRAPTDSVLALGAEIDALHAASMIGLGILDRQRRRLAFADALVAGTFTVAGVAAARASRPGHRLPGHPGGIAGLRDRSADRLARRLVPGYPASRHDARAPDRPAHDPGSGQP